jgi:signal transduction histidine kinase
VTVSADERVDTTGQLDRVTRLLPLPMLAASTVLAWLAYPGGAGSTRIRVTLGLTVVAAALAVIIAAVTRPPKRPSGPAFTALWLGQFALAAVLIGLDPWFGVFGFSCYLLSEGLPRRLIRPACLLTAGIMAASQAVGYPFGRSVGAWVVWLLVAAVNATLVIMFIEINNRMMRQSVERERIIGELNEMNAALTMAMAENAGLHAQLVEQAREAGVQDERQRLAGEIHDTLTQGLIGIITQLEAADQVTRRPDRFRHHLYQAGQLARSSLVEARRSVRALRPEQVEHAGLMHALDELTHDWAESSSTPVRLEAVGSGHLPPDAEDALFRVAQEALANVDKHAAASKVAVTVTYLADVVRLDVLDDGIGWTGSDRPGSYGLAGMRSRLARLGGTVEIETAPGEGTALSACLPVNGATV